MPYRYITNMQKLYIMRSDIILISLTPLYPKKE